MEVGSITFVDPLNVAGTDTWLTVEEQLHARSPELGDILVPLVQARTPVLTGALQSDMTYDAYTQPEGHTGGEEDLVFVYASGEAQLDTWNRIYVAYQEGLPIGLYTYTNDPRSMFLLTAEGDGFEATTIWALETVQYANLLIVSGAGVPS